MTYLMQWTGNAVRNEGKDILVMKESLIWLNDWERDFNSGVIKNMFPTPLTAEGLPEYPSYV